MYFFFDIDGTLLVGEAGEQYMPESTRIALQKLRENGHFVAIATGRAQAMAWDVMQSLGIDNMVSDGGYGLTVNNELVELRPLDRDNCLKLIKECREKNIPWAFNPDNATRRLAPDDRFDRFTNDKYMKNKVIKNLRPEEYDQIYKVYVACDAGEEEEIESLKVLPWCRFSAHYIFVEPCDKAAGIRRMIELKNGELKDVVVFGDGMNDLSMFCPEWTSIAMGNAHPKLKEKADYVTSNAWEDGIFNACSHFGWI